ncbi:MAG: glycosyltransferase family 4 protein [Burkholderiaceae bacterium]|nr:glycosyltransferase family 4 protein [Burkholderiaceae bacterium]
MPAPVPAAPHAAQKPRVLHFVTGGFSGATQVAIDLVRAHLRGGQFESLLVLRRKAGAHTRQRIADLRAQGVDVRTVTGVAHAATIWSLARQCRAFRPDILAAHGFSEHLWGRCAGLLAGVPHLVHVEHSPRERYTAWRLWQARWLAARTDRIVGCSEGVRQRLLELGFDAGKTIAIPNGIHLDAYWPARPRPLLQRQAGIVMLARFSRQKDHATLLGAVALLRARGLRPPVLLAGGGKPRYLRRAMRLAAELGLQEQVRFLGVVGDVAGLLMNHRICALCTHYEGMPLAVLEGMAAGCAVIGSAVPGMRDVIEDGRNGVLVAEPAAPAWADALQRLLTEPAQAQHMAHQAREDALARHSHTLMAQRYEAMFAQLLLPPQTMAGQAMAAPAEPRP